MRQATTDQLSTSLKAALMSRDRFFLAYIRNITLYIISMIIAFVWPE
jgi:hypothetical protein